MFVAYSRFGALRRATRRERQRAGQRRKRAIASKPPIAFEPAARVRTSDRKAGLPIAAGGIFVSAGAEACGEAGRAAGGQRRARGGGRGRGRRGGLDTPAADPFYPSANRGIMGRPRCDPIDIAATLARLNAGAPRPAVYRAYAKSQRGLIPGRHGRLCCAWGKHRSPNHRKAATGQLWPSATPYPTRKAMPFGRLGSRSSLAS